MVSNILKHQISKVERAFGNDLKSFVYCFVWMIVLIEIVLALAYDFSSLEYVFRMVVWLQGISCLVWMVEVWWACPRKSTECFPWLFSCEENVSLITYWKGQKPFFFYTLGFVVSFDNCLWITLVTNSTVCVLFFPSFHTKQVIYIEEIVLYIWVLVLNNLYLALILNILASDL